MNRDPDGKKPFNEVGFYFGFIAIGLILLACLMWVAR